MLNIRHFKPSDREGVRNICCDVADKGGPIEGFFPDREFTADLLTSYYTDYEPDSSFVAEDHGRVVAYINGCMDNRRYGLVLIFLIFPIVLIKGLFLGVFFREAFWRIAKAMLRNWKRVFHWRKKSFDSHQGHLHIGVSKNFRQQHVGEKLVKVLLDHAHQSGISQITASVHDGNLAACRFFERLGFTAEDRYPMVMASGDTLIKYNSITYVKSTH